MREIYTPYYETERQFKCLIKEDITMLKILFGIALIVFIAAAIVLGIIGLLIKLIRFIVWLLL